MTASVNDVCVHLRPILASLLRRAEVIGVSTGWTRVSLAVTISQGPTLDFLRATYVLPTVIETWENHDTHYPVEYGLHCTVCQQSIGWSQATAYSD